MTWRAGGDVAGEGSRRLVLIIVLGQDPKAAANERDDQYEGRARVVRRRFGLGEDSRPRTLREVAAEFGNTERDVRRHESEFLRRVREHDG